MLNLGLGPTRFVYVGVNGRECKSAKEALTLSLPSN